MSNSHWKVTSHTGSSNGRNMTDTFTVLHFHRNDTFDSGLSMRLEAVLNSRDPELLTFPVGDDFIAPPEPIRIGDQERNACIDALTDHYTAGRITQAEFDDRTAKAFRARFQGDLDELLADLPKAHPVKDLDHFRKALEPQPDPIAMRVTRAVMLIALIGAILFAVVEAAAHP